MVIPVSDLFFVKSDRLPGPGFLTTYDLAVASLPEQRSRGTTVLFWSTVPMIALLTVLTWNGMASAGAAFGMAMATLGRWQKDTFKLRWFFVLCSMGWGAHNTIVGSPFEIGRAHV